MSAQALATVARSSFARSQREQRIKDGVHKATYKFRCEATDGTEVWVVTQALPVVTK